jgi:hypothetical protein
VQWYAIFAARIINLIRLEFFVKLLYHPTVPFRVAFVVHRFVMTCGFVGLLLGHELHVVVASTHRGAALLPPLCTVLICSILLCTVDLDLASLVACE